MRVVGMSGPHDAGAGYVAVLLLCSVLGLVREGAVCSRAVSSFRAGVGW
jgi:hypothetical protein